MTPKIDTYFLRNKNCLEKIDDINDLRLFEDIENPQNYAFIYIYPDGKIERVMRTVNLLYHYMAIILLYFVSNDLSKYINKKLASNLLHYESDEQLAKKGVISIYCSSSNIDRDAVFGYINIPSIYTNPQKDALLKFRKYLPYYEDFLINQFNTKVGTLVELNELGDKKYCEVFDCVLGVSNEKIIVVITALSFSFFHDYN